MSAAETFDAMEILSNAKLGVVWKFWDQGMAENGCTPDGYTTVDLLEAYSTLNSAWKYLLRTAWRTCPYCEETDPVAQLERTIQAARCEV